MKTLYSLFLFLLIAVSSNAQLVNIGLLKYNGGGDWYANLETSLPNLITFCNQQMGTNLNPEQVIIEASDESIFELPFIHMTGHGNVIFSDLEVKNLRNYLMAGGFLHIDDNYGMNDFVRIEMKKVFPELNFVELPYNHAIYKEPFSFPKGLPKIHEHDEKRPQGFGLFHEGRLVCYYTYESDLGDGWESPSVHNDPEEKRIQALKMGANIIYYVFNLNE